MNDQPKSRARLLALAITKAIEEKNEEQVLLNAIDLLVTTIENIDRSATALERIADQMEQQTTELRNIEANTWGNR